MIVELDRDTTDGSMSEGIMWTNSCNSYVIQYKATRWAIVDRWFFQSTGFQLLDGHCRMVIVESA